MNLHSFGDLIGSEMWVGKCQWYGIFDSYEYQGFSFCIQNQMKESRVCRYLSKIQWYWYKFPWKIWIQSKLQKFAIPK